MRLVCETRRGLNFKSVCFFFSKIQSCFLYFSSSFLWVRESGDVWNRSMVIKIRIWCIFLFQKDSELSHVRIDWSELWYLSDATRFELLLRKMDRIFVEELIVRDYGHLIAFGKWEKSLFWLDLPVFFCRTWRACMIEFRADILCRNRPYRNLTKFEPKQKYFYRNISFA